MPKSNTLQAVERLVFLVNNGHVEPLKHALEDFERGGLRKEKLINYPVQRYNGRTAVHLAASSGLLDCLGLLLKSGGNPNAVSSPPDLSQTPLHLAASMGYPLCIEILLEHGARMDIKNAHRSTAYNLVRGKVRCERVFQLATARFQIPQRTSDQQKRVEDLHEMVGLEASLDDFYYHYEQLPHDHKDLATRWTDFYQQTLLYRAASCEQIDIVRFMLSQSSSQPLHNLDTNETAVIAACRRDNFDITKLLLQHSPKLVFISEARNKLTPLHVACSRGSLQMVELILQMIKSYAFSDDHDKETEISLDFRDQLGRTPLYNACYYGYYNVAKMIIEFQQEYLCYFSLNVNTAVKNTQRTPLHVAVRKGNLDIVRLLLSVKSTDVSLQGRPSGRTQEKLLATYRKMCLAEESSERSCQRVLSEKVNNGDNEKREGNRGAVEVKEMKDKELLVSMNAVSPPGTRTPPSDFSLISSLTGSELDLSASHSSVSAFHIDDSIGFIAPIPSSIVNRKGPLTESTVVSSSLTRSTSKKCHKSFISDDPTPLLKDEGNTFSKSNSHRENGKHSLSDSTRDTGDDLCNKIFEHLKSGKLEVMRVKKDSEESGYKNFDHIFMTPLAEAVACGHSKIIRVLLAHGARDDSGLACRIAHFVQKLDLMQLILAHHTMLRDNVTAGFCRDGAMDEAGEGEGESGTNLHNMELQWSYKQLPICDGRWLLQGQKFYPNISKDRDGSESVIGEGLCSNTVSREDREEDIAGDSSSNESTFEEGLLSGPRLVISVDAISVVQLDKNQLQSVPLQIFQLPNVRKIDLSQNKIMELPTKVGLPAHFCGKSEDNDLDIIASAWSCPYLKELNISANLLTVLPCCIWCLGSLRKFLCAKNKLTCLYPVDVLCADEILSLSLENVDLSHNCLKGTFSSFVFDFPCLKSLNISDNKIDKLPENLWEHEKLQEVNLANNLLEYLPLCEPEHVYRNSLSMRNLVPTLAPLQQADIVLVGKAAIFAPSIDRNKSMYMKTPSSIQPLNTGADVASHSSSVVVYSYTYSSLQKLNISGNKFTIFPEALPCFAPNLHELDISRNTGLKEIDLMFIPFSLKKLIAKNCGLVRIGNVVPKMRQVLSVQNCRHVDDAGRSCTHRSHHRLPWVTTLDLSQNKIVHLQLIRQHNPESELELTERKEMEYEAKIAPSLDLLYPALEGLNLTSNSLAGMFNPNIGHQIHLKWIKLSKNYELTEIPMEFAYLKKTKQLSELRIDDLPNLMEPPVEYQKVRLNHLLTYMRSRLKESDYYRSIKLFFVGNGERGKTTLLRRLRGMADDKHVDRTVGIDIVSWVYCPDKKRLLFKEKRKPVQFLAMDFAGQHVYHTTHQCFYSRRSMYLALFRLTDGQGGIDELEPWLRNIQLRAPGCPVIIVGTHLDAMTDLIKVKDLENKVRQKYSQTAHYPKMVDVVSISCIRRLFSNTMDELRNMLYNVACHLSLGSDGTSLEYKPSMLETDPKALFQQLIPRTFLTLQEKIGEKVLEMKGSGRAPIMEDSEFKTTFQSFVEDEEELNEAVYFLNLQGTLLHFEDHTLKCVYFLDPEWLAKLMADVIHPAAMGKATHIRNGVAEISGLFLQRDMPLSMKDHYISLLEKFEVALKINSSQMIIPSLMPDQSSYPKTNELLSDITGSTLESLQNYQPPLRRFWLADYMPEGFWPRLICRVATDPQISRVLRVVIGEGNHISPSLSPADLSPVTSNRTVGSRNSPSLLMPPFPNAASYGRKSPSFDRIECHEILNWTPWKTGIAFAHRGRTLLVMKQVTNQPSDEFLKAWGTSVHLLKSEYRIEIHIYTNEWVTLCVELMDLNLPSFPLDNMSGLATKLLVMLTGHVKTLATTFFAGMLSLLRGGMFSSYVPCWKCFAEIGSPKDLCAGIMKGLFVCKASYPVSTFVVEDHIVTAAMNRPLECSLHGDIAIVHMAPDLIFWDLTSDVAYQDNTTPLHICEDEVLGKGGFGFVCKGELKLTVDNFAEKKNVAVKFFLEDVTQLLETSSISELLKKSKEPKHLLYAYREIRQEVCFLSNFDHPHLANLCGVRTSPYLCLMLELAPRKSLHAILKEYKMCQVALEPLTLKNAALQIAQGLEYLHSNQIVHLDMKSPNVLLWHFPSPRYSRSQRIQQSGNVWLKIADYGISQVSTGLSLRVDNAPVGTPGYMAPELFERAGQVISSDKVDVFAYGMVLFELLSQRSPFANIQPPVKRNSAVKDGKRPILDVRETRSPLLLQELMFVCWKHDPHDRPRMEQVVEWILAPEFERLRAEISLNDVKSISCACVCRIHPEYESSLTIEKADSLMEQTEPVYKGIVDSEAFNKDIGAIGNLDSLIQKYGGSGEGCASLCGIDLIVQNMLPSVPLESACIVNSEGEKISNSDEDIYQFLPSKLRRSTYRNTDLRKRRMAGNRRRKMKSESSEKDLMEMNPSVANFDPYTQIWMCGRDQRKGLLQILTFNDGHSGYYHFNGYCSRDEITSLCPVRNMMWMGTTSGVLKVFHAPTLKVKFTCTLEREEPEGTSNRTILDILFVEEIRTVLIANFSGEMWSFFDTVVDDGLRLLCKIALQDDSPCYHLVKVVLDSGKLEVWGTMENNRILVLEHNPITTWKHNVLTVKPKDPKLRLCSYVAFSSFTAESGEQCKHAWISYRQRSVLVSFDANTKEQRCILNCADKLKKETSQTFQVTNLICSGCKVIVGTSIGSVGIFNSKTLEVIQLLTWHKDKVRMLLVMPQQVDACICAEVPFPDQEKEDCVNKKYPMESSLTLGRKLFSQKLEDNRTNKNPVYSAQLSYLDNKYCIFNPEPESRMITSIGNGRCCYDVHTQTKEDQVQIFNKAVLRKSAHKASSRQKWDDIVLRTWRI